MIPADVSTGCVRGEGGRSSGRACRSGRWSREFMTVHKGRERGAIYDLSTILSPQLAYLFLLFGHNRRRCNNSSQVSSCLSLPLLYYHLSNFFPNFFFLFFIPISTRAPFTHVITCQPDTLNQSARTGSADREVGAAKRGGDWGVQHGFWTREWEVRESEVQ